MNRSLSALSLLGVLALAPLQAASIMETHSFNGLNAAVPDGNPSGLANLQNISSQITEIQDITVTLNISGTYNGDLYVYLQHGSEMAVLLNRVGRSGGNAFGFNNDGFQISLNDLGAFSDIHGQDSGGGLLSGSFASDGRNVDPDNVLGTDPRGALLTGFVGGDANGDWTLFAADLSGGDQHTLNSWSIEITGVPEPGTLSLLLFGAILLGRRKR